MGGWRKRVMGQKSFFDIERRLEAISAKGDPLETIKKIVPQGVTLGRPKIDSTTERKVRRQLAKGCWYLRRWPSRQARAGTHRVEKDQRAVSLWPVEKLDQGEESEGSSSNVCYRWEFLIVN